MSLLRPFFVLLMMFVLGGVPDVLAADKQPKAKITAQPVERTAELGDSVEFQVVFTSASGATCQWRHNKVPISGATDSTYVIDAVLPEDAGKYDVVITNSGGVTTSRTVTLTVNLAPASLPVDAILDGSFTVRVAGESISSDGAYVVTGAATLQDPEAPLDAYSFTYTRQSENKAKLVISGTFYDEEFGDYIDTQESHTLTFTGVSSDGELLATASSKGFFELPEGMSPSRLKFTAKGTITIQMVEPSAPVSGAVLMISGTGVVNDGGTRTVNSSELTKVVSDGSSISLSGSNTYTGTTTVNAGSLLLNGAGVTLANTGVSTNVGLGSTLTISSGLVGGDSSSSLSLSGANTYTGVTTINAGSLLLNGAGVISANTGVSTNVDLGSTLTISSGGLVGVVDTGGVLSFDTIGTSPQTVSFTTIDLTGYTYSDFTGTLTLTEEGFQLAPVSVQAPASP